MTRLPRSLPTEQGVDPAAVLDFLDAVDSDPAVEVHSMMLLRRGHVVAEGWWAPHTPERDRLVYSVSKSFTATALGFALDEGLVRLDDTVVSHFPELADDAAEDAMPLTLRDLASMASGHDHDTWQDALASDPLEPVRGFLRRAPNRPVGQHFTYNQSCTYTLAAVIQRRSGMRLTEYLRPRLFAPLGIGEVAWQSRPAGREIGFSGLYARTEDIAKLGLLYLRRGRWDDRQLIPQWYVDEATSVRVATPAEPTADWRQGYGYQFWISRHGFRADGAFGQFALVLPEQDVVVALTAGTEATQELLDHVWRHLLPGCEAFDPGNDRQAELDQRLEGLQLAPAPGHRPPSRWEDWTSASFSVTTQPEEPLASTITSIGITGTSEALRVALAEPANELTVDVGIGTWAVSESRDLHGDVVPVAASAGWLDQEHAELYVVFLATPHRMDIRCSLPAGTAEAIWRAAPLDGGALETLHRPR
jgi:CubicO group peptidase (beta-lactamase class C family)